MDILDKANELQERIEDLERFLFTIDPISGDDERNYVCLRVRKTTELSLFGSRFYGIGTNCNELKIPKEVYLSIRMVAKKELNNRKDELESMFIDKANGGE